MRWPLHDLQFARLANVIPSFLLFCALAFAAQRAPGANEPCIVTLRPGADADKVAKEFKLKPKHTYRHALNGFAVALDSDKVKKLKSDKRVLAVEPDGRFELLEQTNSTGIIRMGLTNFPFARINGLDERINVDVAVLDTGIQTNHPDLNVVQAVDVTGLGRGGDDRDGHGTAMAGVIGALDNDFGVVGVAPGVRLWSIQASIAGVFGEVLPLSDILAGMDYITTNADKIAVVNMSFGRDISPGEPYEAIHHAVSNLVDLGIVVVAGSGNDGNDIFGSDLTPGGDYDILPAALPEVMTVSAMDPMTDTIWTSSNASFSNKVPSHVTSPGLGLDVTAPGVNILTTDKGTNYATGTGTSAATAHVSGLVALYIAANGRATNAEGVYRIRQAIVNSAQPQSQWQNPNSDPDGNPEPLAIPSESWIPQPRIVSQSASATNFQFSFTTVPGYRYTPERADSLIASNQWANLTATNGTGAPTTVSDPVLNAIRYYRVKREPAL